MKRTIEQITDDLDGTPLTPGDNGRTLTFGLDGRTYTIDLTSDNANALAAALAPYIAAGRRNSTTKLPTVRPARENAEIRRWAKAHGYTLASRGTIPHHIRTAYIEARAIA